MCFNKIKTYLATTCSTFGLICVCVCVFSCMHLARDASTCRVHDYIFQFRYGTKYLQELAKKNVLNFTENSTAESKVATMVATILVATFDSAMSNSIWSSKVCWDTKGHLLFYGGSYNTVCMSFAHIVFYPKSRDICEQKVSDVRWKHENDKIYFIYHIWVESKICVCFFGIENIEYFEKFYCFILLPFHGHNLCPILM